MLASRASVVFETRIGFDSANGFCFNVLISASILVHQFRKEIIIAGEGSILLTVKTSDRFSTEVFSDVQVSIGKVHDDELLSFSLTKHRGY